MLLKLASFQIVCGMLIALASRSSDAMDPAAARLKLTSENYSTWRDHILPAEKDLGWQQIPWLTTFQDGILDANQRNLPVLLWTMNGHPLGCT